MSTTNSNPSQEDSFVSEEAKTNPDVPFGQLSLATQGRCVSQLKELLARHSCLPKPLYNIITEYAVWNHGDLKIGSVIDCRDFLNDWYNASVIQVKGSSVLIHYIGWSRKWDEWLDRRCESDLERMAPAFHKTVRWGRDIRAGDIVHIKTPYRDSREARVLQIMKCGNLLRLSAPTTTLTITMHRRLCDSGCGSGDDVVALRIKAAQVFYRLARRPRTAVAAGPDMHMQPPTPVSHRELNRSDLTAAYLDDDPDPRECVEFLRAFMQQPDSSRLLQQVTYSPELDHLLQELGAVGQTAVPMWLPSCDVGCSCYDNPDRASVICLQNLTGHRHVHRWCSGGEIAIWKSSTSPDQIREREAREREPRQAE